jgi:hypothetical protein
MHKILRNHAENQLKNDLPPCLGRNAFAPLGIGYRTHLAGHRINRNVHQFSAAELQRSNDCRCERMDDFDRVIKFAALPGENK